MDHPYKAYENTALWKSIDAALADLERNRDVEVMTSRERVVGYLCQQLGGNQASSQDEIK